MTVEVRVQLTLSVLDRAVVESVAYSDVFDYPVTLEEIRRSLPIIATDADVEASLQAVRHYVSSGSPYYVLAGREALAETRARRAEASRRLLRRAGFYGRLIARLPFVRMVAVTGSLAVDNAEEDHDIDYMIVTAPGRVWLARALSIVVVRFAALRGLTLCPNYVLSQSALTLPERDAYTARELLQMRVLAGHGVYAHLLERNAWWFDLLPNWRPAVSNGETKRGLVRRLGEWLLGGSLGDALERRLLRRKGAELRAQAEGNAEAVFDETVCKGHFEGHRARLEASLTERLARLGLLP
jgi:hypothetical protein